MFTKSSSPNVLVTVNNLVGVCQSDCTYTFENSVPEITAQSLSLDTLSLSVSDPLSQNYPLSSLIIKLDDNECIGSVGTLASFTCNISNLNPDITPMIRAGSHHTQI